MACHVLFFSIPADFPVSELQDFELLMLVCVYLCRCSEEAASWCHRLRGEGSGNNLADRQQGQWEEGERGGKKDETDRRLWEGGCGCLMLPHVWNLRAVI